MIDPIVSEDISIILIRIIERELRLRLNGPYARVMIRFIWQTLKENQ